MINLWDDLPALTQDTLLLVALLLPALVVGFAVLRKLRPGPLVRAMLWRFRWANILFTLLIAVSVGIGIGLLAQERGLRRGTAASAEKFDLVVAAPGSEITMMLATVYLQPSDVGLLSGEVYERVSTHDHVAIAAPVAFGDSFDGTPIIGTTAEFVDYLTEGAFSGANLTIQNDAIAGALVPLEIGETFTPVHGHGDAAEESHDARMTIVGRMAATGTPWDRAILVPVESIWAVHDLPNGHAAGDTRIGPPFDPALFPGTPAILVHTDELWANYALRSVFESAPDTMAFFPGAVLVRLYGIMGDIRQAMSVMSLTTQGLVSASVLVGLLILIRLFQRQLALLRALGAPGRFIFAVVWSYASVLLAVGSALGLVVGQAATLLLSRVLTAKTDILIQAPLGWPEFHFVAGFVSCATLLALLPAGVMLHQQIVPTLRA